MTDTKSENTIEVPPVELFRAVVDPVDQAIQSNREGIRSFLEILTRSGFLLNGGSMLALAPILALFEAEKRGLASTVMFEAAYFFFMGLVFVACAALAAAFAYYAASMVLMEKRSSNIDNFVQLLQGTEMIDGKSHKKRRWSITFGLAILAAIVMWVMTYLAFVDGVRFLLAKMPTLS